MGRVCDQEYSVGPSSGCNSGVSDGRAGKCQKLTLNLLEVLQLEEVWPFQLVRMQVAIGRERQNVLAMLEGMMNRSLKYPVFLRRQQLSEGNFVAALPRIN